MIALLQLRPSSVDLASFFERVEVSSSGCWRWTGCLTGKGYGAFRGHNAHSYSFAWFVGELAQGHEIDHTCRVRLCVNPAHLEAVTSVENKRRANRWLLTGRCRRGHAIVPANIGTRFSSDGVLERFCVECRRLSQARYLRRRGVPLPPFAIAVFEREAARHKPLLMRSA